MKWMGLSLVAVAAGVFLTTCTNPFFPPTGPSLMSGRQRSTVQGVVAQLLASYESRNINQFLVLFDAAQFRFYVAPGIVGRLQSLDRNRREQVSDSVFLPDDERVYTYLTYADERRIHQNLFSKSDEIFFLVPPQIDSIFVQDTFVRIDTVLVFDTVYDDSACLVPHYRDPCLDVDTLVSPDTLYVPVYDTLVQIVRTLESVLSIRSLDRIGPEPLNFNLGKQVFYMVRDDEGLWVIRRWYELD